jgi:predicted transcriptional regulator
MKLRKELTPEQKGGIIACNKLGITQKKIAEVVECTQSAVSRFLSTPSRNFGLLLSQDFENITLHHLIFMN